MNVLFAWGFGGGEVIVVLVAVLLLFGAKKLPELARGLGQGIREFKKASNEVTSEIQRAMDDDTSSKPSSTTPKMLSAASSDPAPAPKPSDAQPS